ncbi:MAG: RsmB/NOP family class I SAM-dependent RNA methyltransferase [Alphaproteobacteria bacterium]
MTPGARIQASIELLDAILDSWQSEKRFPADKQIDMYFKSRRFIGSKDRAAIGELVYWVLRHKMSLAWWVKAGSSNETSATLRNSLLNESTRISGRDYVLAALMMRKNYDVHSIQNITKDGAHCPAPLTAEEGKMCGALHKQEFMHPDMPDYVRLNYPAWLTPHLKASFGDEFEQAVLALNEQAHTDLRVNTLKTTREELLENLKAEGFDVSPCPRSPVGIRLAKRAPIFTSRHFKEGHFEVQDEGSQMVAQLVDAAPGMRVIDFCAGAGGKTLAIAAAMKNKGRVLAWDNSAKRLTQIKERLKRSGVDTVETHVIENENDQHIKRHKGTADRVLVDAPCSGTGTWRRNPDLKWRFTLKDLEEVLAVQQSILQSAARLVKPGGRLIYATCSILKEENEQQVERLLINLKDFRVVCAKKIWDKTSPASESDTVSYFRVAPHQDGVDGFFAAILERYSGQP